jgi:hypothetical protein
MVVGSPLARGPAGHVQQLGREKGKPHRSNGHLLFSLPATSRARSAAAVVGFWSALGPRAFTSQAVPPQSVACSAIKHTQVALVEARVRMEWPGCASMWKMTNVHRDFEGAIAGHGSLNTLETVSCHPRATHAHAQSWTHATCVRNLSEFQFGRIRLKCLGKVCRNRAQCSRCLCETLHV